MYSNPSTTVLASDLGPQIVPVGESFYWAPLFSWFAWIKFSLKGVRISAVCLTGWGFSLVTRGCFCYVFLLLFPLFFLS